MTSRNTSSDRARITLFTELFASVAEEMGIVLERAAFSPNIKERQDYSCAVFGADGRLVAQAAHIPVHLGAMELLMRRWLLDGPKIESGRVYVANNPFFAGTHLPDVSILRAVDADGVRVGYVAARAHHADIGGSAPGSIAPVASVHEEGILIEPQELTELCLENIITRCRNPEERKADFEAQRACTLIGAARFAGLARRYGEELKEQIERCNQYSASMTRAVISALPNGSFCAEDSLENVIGGAHIKLRITKLDGHILFDFNGTDEQRAIGINATEAVTRSACYYVLRCLCPDAPTNSGCWENVEVVAPPGTLVNATFPAPVVAGNTETSQRIVDIIFQALSPVMPACSQGTMNNFALGTRSWAYYETIAGGAGGGMLRHGASAIHCHMTNTRNTPIEAIENELPIRIRKYAIREGTGGAGLHTGGDGVVKEFEILKSGVILTLMADRREKGPPGNLGGESGSTGQDTLIRKGVETRLDSKTVEELQEGDIVRIETPGGGGWRAPV